MIKVVLFGVAINAVLLIETGGLKENVEIVGCVDNDTSKIGKEFYDFSVTVPEEIHNMEFDYVIILSSTNYVAMAEQMMSYGVPANKIIINYEYGHESYFADKICSQRSAVLARGSSQKRQSDYSTVNVEHDLINDTVMIKIPIELIRVCSESDGINAFASTAIKDGFGGNHIDYQVYRSPYYTELFEYMSGESEKFPENYLDLPGCSKDYAHTLIMRKEFYNQHMKILQNGVDYYQEHCEPILVKYNKNQGFFALLDGNHRTTFLYTKGIRFVHACMSYCDYLNYINSDKIKAVIEAFDELNDKNLYSPVLHPAFYRVPALRDTTFPTRMEYAFKALRGYELKGKKVVDIGCNNGYASRMLAREGADVTAIEMEADIYQLAVAVSALENTKINFVNKKFEELADDEHYDIAIMMTVLYWYLDDENILNAFFAKLNQRIDQMLIWESGDKPELEKNLILQNTKFKKYKKLAITVGTGKLRELGIFTIN